VSIDPSANYDETVGAIQEVVNGYPGLHHAVRTYLNEISSEVSAKPNDSLSVRVYGDTDVVLRSAAEDAKAAMAGINGIVAMHVQLPVEEPALEIEVNLAEAQRYGIKPGDVRRAAATMFSGLQVGSLFEEQKVFDVVVWSTPNTRNSLSSVRELLIDTPSGGRVRLGEVAQVRIVPTASVIRHEAVHRYLDVVADVQGRELGSVAADVKSRLQQVRFPLEYHAEVVGEFTEQQAGQNRLLVFAAAAALGIFFLLQAAFRSWRLAILSFLTLPSALAGGVLVLLVTGGIFSLGSLAGFLAVFGIAARGGILLINHYQHLERYEGEVFGLSLALRGARERLSPVLMTALATGLALVPALLQGDIPGLEVVRPMAFVMLGGLLTATLLNLFIVPALYLGVRVSRVQDLELVPVTAVAGAGVLAGAPAVPSMSASGK
jgi:Cu/Ag efflux pump CusA